MHLLETQTLLRLRQTDEIERKISNKNSKYHRVIMRSTVDRRPRPRPFVGSGSASAPHAPKLIPDCDPESKHEKPSPPPSMFLPQLSRFE